MTRKIKSIVKNFTEDSKKLLKENLIAEFLFGSTARNELSEFSDIDILIIVKNLNYPLRESVSSLSSEYSIKHDLCISPVLKDQITWEQNKTYNTLLYQEVKRDGIQLC